MGNFDIIYILQVVAHIEFVEFERNEERGISRREERSTEQGEDEFGSDLCFFEVLVSLLSFFFFFFFLISFCFDPDGER